jgi:hypothetical protein
MKRFIQVFIKTTFFKFLYLKISFFDILYCVWKNLRNYGANYDTNYGANYVANYGANYGANLCNKLEYISSHTRN